MSHNRFPGAVYGVDGQYVPVQYITNYLNGQHCPSLQGKPKLFFIQACGGGNIQTNCLIVHRNGSCVKCLCFCSQGERDTGFEVSPDEVEPSGGGLDDQTDAIPTSSSSDSLSLSDEVDARATLPTPSDILVSYSTFPGAFMTNYCYLSELKRVISMPFSPRDKHRLRLLERHPVGLLVRRDTGPHSWGKLCHRRLGHNVNDGQRLLFYHLEPCWSVYYLLIFVFIHFQVNHEVSQNSAKGLYKQMPGSFNFLRKLLYFQTQA